MGLYRDNGKENGSYYSLGFKVTTTLFRVWGLGLKVGGSGGLSKKLGITSKSSGGLGFRSFTGFGVEGF